MRQCQRGLIPSPRAVREELARNYGQARLLRRLLKLCEDAAVEDGGRYRTDRRPQTEARPEEVGIA
jgi:hypothetical protein